MGVRKILKDFRNWCPQPPNPLPSKLKRYSAPITVLLTVTLLAATFTALVLIYPIIRPVPQAPALPLTTPTSTPTLTSTPTPTTTSPSPSPTSSPTEVGYWTLNISPTTGVNLVTPNGTIQVPMSQSGINVTATPTGWNGFMYWIFDGKQVASQSPAIFIPTQQANSSHTLVAQFVVGTPPIWQIVNGNITVNAGSYNDYSFTIPSDSSYSEVQGTFTVSGGSGNTITVYIMDSTNFANWQNGQTTSSYCNSTEAPSGTSNVNLNSGTYFLVFDNTSDLNSQKSVYAEVFYWYIPSD